MADKPLTRREAMTSGLGLFAASLVIPPFLRPFTNVTRTVITGAAAEDAPEKGVPSKLKSRGPEKTVIDPKFAKYLGEKLVYEVDFMYTVKAAQVTVTLRQGSGEEIIGELEAKALGVVGWATNMKRQVFSSRLVVREIDGVKRLIPTTFSRVSEKGDKVTKSIHRFLYDKHKRLYSRTVNGKMKRRQTKKIPADVKMYEDFVGFAYNVRAGVYGDIVPGKEIKIRTVPYKGVDEYTIRVAGGDEMKKHAKWFSKNPEARYLGVVKIHQKIFGLKTGEGYVMTDKDLVPVAGKIKDVVTFGDVSTRLVQRSGGSPSA
ncbi:DUF3108 domain-containing protein [bacterium]|nr:DUF3108 domain-containing protein [bacterium]